MSSSTTPATPLVLDTGYPWADLVIDLNTERGYRLPDVLPQAHPFRYPSSPMPAHERMGGERVTVAGTSPRRGELGNLVLRVVDPTNGDRVAVVYAQDSARSVDPRQLGFFLGLSDADADELGRRNAVEGEAHEVLGRLLDVGRLLRSPRWQECASDWGSKEAWDWVRLMLCGITDPEHRSLLDASGFRLGGGRKVDLSRVAKLRNALKVGLSVEQAAEWWPLMEDNGPTFVLTGIRHGLACADVLPWKTTTMHVGGEALGQEYLDDRFGWLVVAKDQEWTPDVFRAVEAVTPPGCSPQTWMQTWTRFMPADLAGSYAEAGYDLVEAVRFHLTGQDLSTETLGTLAGLRAPVR